MPIIHLVASALCNSDYKYRASKKYELRASQHPNRAEEYAGRVVVCAQYGASLVMKSVICPRRDGAAVEDEEQPRKNHHYQRARTLKKMEELCPRITLGTTVPYYSCSSNSQLVSLDDCIFF